MQMFEIGEAAVIQPHVSAGWNFCPAGVVRAIDEHGVRIALVEFLMGSVTDTELFLPWGSIVSAECSKNWRVEDEGDFNIGKTQTRMNECLKRSIEWHNDHREE